MKKTKQFLFSLIIGLTTTLFAVGLSACALNTGSGTSDSSVDSSNSATFNPNCQHLTKTEKPAKGMTCQVGGYPLHYVCDDCGMLFLSQTDTAGYTEIEQLPGFIPPEHILTERPGQTVSCTQDGYPVYYDCKTCELVWESLDNPQGYESIEQLPSFEAAHHDLTTYPGREASCTQDGYPTHYICNACGDILTSPTGSEVYDAVDQLPGYKKSQHTPVYVPEIPASCTQTGVYEHYQCTACLKTFEDEVCNYETPYESLIISAGHVYNQEVPGEQYKYADNTCTTGTAYYKSCECGVSSEDAGLSNPPMFYADDKLGHTYNQQTAKDDFVKTPATCQTVAVYYVSCSCGASSKNTANEQTFNGDTFSEHVYGNKRVTDTYLCTVATCTSSAVYYYSCNTCDKVGTLTFTTGTTIPHNYITETVHESYFKSAATCQQKATYYKSCSACHKSSRGTDQEAVFEDGELLPCYYPTDTSLTCTMCREGRTSEGLQYTLIGEGDDAYYVLSGIGSCMDKVIVVPTTYDGKAVKGISATAFAQENTTVEVIQILWDDEWDITIEEGAFAGLTNLKTVWFENSIEEWFEVDGHEYVESLEDITILFGTVEKDY